MMPASLRDSTNDVRCLRWFSADSLDARLAASDWRLIRIKRPKISSCKTPAARLRSRSCPTHETKWAAPPLRSITRTPDHAANSP
jgi:hypothetical protein